MDAAIGGTLEIYGCLGEQETLIEYLKRQEKMEKA